MAFRRDVIHCGKWPNARQPRAGKRPQVSCSVSGTGPCYSASPVVFADGIQFRADRTRKRTVHFQSPRLRTGCARLPLKMSCLVKEVGELVGNSPCGGLQMKAQPAAACWLCKGRGRRRHCPEKEGAERRHYSQVVSQDTSLRGPQVLHQLRI